MPPSTFHIHCTKMIFGFSEVLSDDGSPTATVPMVPKRRRVTKRYRPLNSDEQVGDIFFSLSCGRKTPPHITLYALLVGEGGAYYSVDIKTQHGLPCLTRGVQPYFFSHKLSTEIRTFRYCLVMLNYFVAGDVRCLNHRKQLKRYSHYLL